MISALVKVLPETLRTRISGRTNLKAVAGNSIWLFSDKILRMGVGLIVGVWVARYLGPDRFGLLNYGIAFTSLFGSIATLGLDGIVIRDLVNHPERRNVLLGSAFTLKLLGSCTAFAIAVIAISIMQPGQTLTLYVVSLAALVFVFQSTNVIDLVFQSRVQSRYTVYAANSAFILMALTKIFLLLHSAPLIAFAWTVAGEAILTALFLLIAYRLLGMNVMEWRVSLDVILDLLKASWPLILTGISIVISTRADQVLIGQMLTNQQVGIYSAAVRIAEIWYFIPLGIAGSAFPILIETRKQSEAVYYERLQQLYTLLVMLSVAFAIAMTLLSGFVVKLLYGPAYEASAGVLSVLMWSGVPVAFGCVWSNWMLLENRTKTMFYFQLNSAVVNVVLNIVLIPRFGIVGSAYATLISYSIGHTLLAVLMKSQRGAFKMLCKALFPFWTLFAPDKKQSI